MKIFRFIKHNKISDLSLYDDVDVTTIPDTALLIQKRPFFIPDFTKQCMAQLCACIRINRLGRSIHERFAHRYYNAEELTLSVHFVAHDLLDLLQQRGKPWELAIGFDNAVVVADKKVKELSDEMNATLQINDNKYTCNFNTKQLFSIVDKQLARISEFYTMRQGDLMLLPLQLNEKKVEIDDNIQLNINEENLVSFNVK